MKPRTFHQACRETRRGFTLVELMVVILVIIVIAALSLTGMRRFRDYADKVNSSRNLSLLQLANASHAADHNGRYVAIQAYDENGARTGYGYQDPTYLGYLTGDVDDTSGKPLRAAPSSFLDPKVYRARKTMYYSMSASYGMLDSGLMGQAAPNARPAHQMNAITYPSAAMVFATATDYRINYNGRFSWTEDQARSNNGALAYRYGGKALLVYYDGHIGEMTKADIQEIDKSRGGKNNPLWKPTAN
jgi:prepilin-type N-terminal cleavage/methylation domain-containing protein